jgi:hypothetical protein
MFFHGECRPLFSNILWQLYGNNADYDELVNDLYLYLKEPAGEDELFWRCLRTFDYRTSLLFNWIRTVAVRRFYTSGSEVFKVPEHLIELGVAEELFPEELANELGTPVSNVYNLKKRAIDQLHDAALYFREVDDIETYINLMSCDRNREIIRSIYMQG